MSRLYMNLGLFNPTANKADDRPRPCHFSSWLLLLYISPKQMPRLAAPSWIVSELCFDPKQAHMLPKPGLQRKTGGCPFGRHSNHLWRWQGIHPVSNYVWVSFTLENINVSYSHLDQRTTAVKGSSGSHFYMKADFHMHLRVARSFRGHRRNRHETCQYCVWEFWM